MYTVTINLQISFEEENQACNKELIQLIYEELKQSAQLIPNKYNKTSPHSVSGSNTPYQISLDLPTMKPMS